MLMVILSREGVTLVHRSFQIAAGAVVDARGRDLFAWLVYCIPMCQFGLRRLLDSFFVDKPSHLISSALSLMIGSFMSGYCSNFQEGIRFDSYADIPNDR